jgi:hypothetical protein
MLAVKQTAVKCSTIEHFNCPSLPLTRLPVPPYRLAILPAVFPFEAGSATLRWS